MKIKRTPSIAAPRVDVQRVLREDREKSQLGEPSKIRPLKTMRAPELVIIDDPATFRPETDGERHPLVDATVAEIEEGVGKLLRGQDAGPQPWCTCGKTGGFTFDWQLGVYVHAECYKPSFAYHKAAVQAGIIAPSRMLR